MGCNESKNQPITDNKRQQSAQRPAGQQSKTKQPATSSEKAEQRTARNGSASQAKPADNVVCPAPMKLVYFDARGRVEPIRIVLAYAGVQYEDERISFEKWPELKPKTPFGSLPLLKIGDDLLFQSVAILQYLANQYGMFVESINTGSMRIYVDLCGCDAEERAKCDMLIYCMEDFGAISRPNRFKFRTGALSEEERQEVAKKICDEELPRLVKLIESHMGEKWLLSKLTVADFWLYGQLENTSDALVPDLWDKVGDRLKKWKEDFESIPEVYKYLFKTRPQEFKL